MSIRLFLAAAFLLFSVGASAQPVWSAEVRAERNVNWFRDSLQMKGEALKKCGDIELKYQQKIDKESEKSGQYKNKTKAHLLRKKDTEMRAIMNAEQFQRYMRREREIRRQMYIKYEGRYQPL